MRHYIQSAVGKAEVACCKKKRHEVMKGNEEDKII